MATAVCNMLVTSMITITWLAHKWHVNWNLQKSMNFDSNDFLETILAYFNEKIQAVFSELRPTFYECIIFWCGTNWMSIEEFKIFQLKNIFQIVLNKLLWTNWSNFK